MYKILMTSVTIISLWFIYMLISPVLGGIAGWLIGGIFPFVVNTINDLIGSDLTGFQIGVILGFIRSFLRQQTSDSK